MEKQTVYYVYDREWNEIIWSEVMGFGQLTKFACDQIVNAPDDFIKENLESTLNDEEVQKVLHVVEVFGNTIFPNYPKLTKEEIDLILKVRCFNIEEKEVY